MPNNKKLYRKYLTVTLTDGSKKQLQFYGKTEREANQKRERARIEYEAGALILGAKTTVADYAIVFNNELKDQDNKSRLQRLIVDQIGYLKIEEVRAPHIRAIFHLLDGQSSSTITKGVSLVKKFFRQAIADGLIVRDPCINVPRPAAKESTGRRSMTEEEENLFLMLLNERITDGIHFYDIAWGLMYACGLRPGEVRALQHNNIFFGESPKIIVTQACKAKTKKIGAPKTAAGIREVPIPLWFLPLLEKGINKKSFFAVPSKDGECMNYQCMKRRWNLFYKAMQRQAGAKTYRNKIIVSPIGQDLDPYCLRHTYCTNLAFSGIPEVIAMRWMGHSDPNMIRKIYTDAANAKLVRSSIEKLNSKPI